MSEAKDIQCPYCGQWQAAAYDNREENKSYQHDCVACGKIFGYTIEYSPTYTEHPIPCANGEPHKWKAVWRYPGNTTQLEACRYCNQLREMETST